MVTTTGTNGIQQRRTKNPAVGGGGGGGNSINRNKQEQQQQQQNIIKSVDTLLQKNGKLLQVGERFHIQLMKGVNPFVSKDPVDKKAPTTVCPLIAKFPNGSVVKPNFFQKNARLFEQDKPKPIDDSDDEDTNNNADQQRKKKWKYNRPEIVQRQWILQEEVDFLQTMMNKREHTKKQTSTTKNNSRGPDGNGTGTDDETMTDEKNSTTTPTVSSLYEGTFEHTTSRYALIRVAPSDDNNNGNQQQQQKSQQKLIVQMIPAMATITFQQPLARHALTLSQAEQLIQDQRAGIRSTVQWERTARSGGGSGTMVQQQQAKNSSSSPPGTDGSTVTNMDSSSYSTGNKPSFGLGPSNLFKKKGPQSIKERLLQKIQSADKKKTGLQGEEDDDGDDIMGDVAFRSRKRVGGSGGAPASSAARRELLSSMGDGLTVSEDGVLGGTNDSIYGGKQRFGNLRTENNTTQSANNNSSADGYNNDGDGMMDQDNNNNTNRDRDESQRNERGGDGAAMDDDFYTRDVGAEYEEVDYDANEQFDDDDVDVGEADQDNGDNNNNTTSNNNNNNQDEDDDDDETTDSDDDSDDGNIGGVEGLASVAGFKALLAKARGEVSAIQQQQQQGGDGSTTTNPDGSSTNNNNNDPNSLQTTQSMSRKRQKFSHNNNNNNDQGGGLDHFSKIFAATDNDQRGSGHHHNKKQQQNPTTTNQSTTATNTNNSSTHHHPPTTTTTTTTAAAATETAVQPVVVAAATTGIQLDEHGLRLITLDAVQQEIWLNHGSITIKKLMKIFDVKKKSSEQRQNQFRDIVKELCTMTNDVIKGNLLVLKQHYSKK